MASTARINVNRNEEPAVVGRIENRKPHRGPATGRAVDRRPAAKLSADYLCNILRPVRRCLWAGWARTTPTMGEPGTNAQTRGVRLNELQRCEAEPGGCTKASKTEPRQCRPGLSCFGIHRRLGPAGPLLTNRVRAPVLLT